MIPRFSWSWVENRLVVAGAGGDEGHVREGRRVCIPRLREQPAGLGRIVGRDERRVAPAGDPGRDHRGGRERRGAVGELDDPPPVHARREGPPHARVVEGGPLRLEAVVGDREVGPPAQAGPEVGIVGEPRRVGLADRRPVQLARRKDVDRAAAADVGDGRDLVDRGRPGPVAGVGEKRVAVRHGGAEQVAARTDESWAGLQGGRVAADGGRDNGQRRAGGDRGEVTGRACQADLHRGPGGDDPDLVGARCSGRVVAGSLHVVEQRRQRRRPPWVDDTEPAAAHVVGGERRAVGELEVRPQGEDDRPSAVAKLPALGEGRAGRPRRVDRGEALEQLGDEGGAPGIAGRRRIEGRRLAHQDPDRSRRRPCRCRDERGRREHDGHERGHGRRASSRARGGAPA